MELKCDCDWDELKKILDEAPKESEGIEYKGNKYIKEEYCILKSKIKDRIENIEISINDIRDNLDINEAMLCEIRRLEERLDVLQDIMKD